MPRGDVAILQDEVVIRTPANIDFSSLKEPRVVRPTWFRYRYCKHRFPSYTIVIASSAFVEFMTALPILYSFRRCPYAMRARLALAVTGLEVEHREVVLRDKPKEMLEVSPKGTVPVLVLPDGQVIEESEDIMLWALGQRDPRSWLAPETESLDAMRLLVRRTEEEFKIHLDRYKYSNRYEGADSEEHRGHASTFLRELDARLAKSPYLYGDRLVFADAAIAPFVRQFANTDREWFDAQTWPALKQWLEEFLASPRFIGVMGKHAQWVPTAAPDAL